MKRVRVEEERPPKRHDVKEKCNCRFSGGNRIETWWEMRMVDRMGDIYEEGVHSDEGTLSTIKELAWPKMNSYGYNLEENDLPRRNPFFNPTPLFYLIEGEGNPLPKSERRES